jgi:hypothetical protein
VNIAGFDTFDATSQKDLEQQSWKTRSGSASNDIVYVPEASPITDESLTLTLNGLQFTGLYDGDRRLHEGCDYTVVGGKLTLTSALLTQLAGDRSVGVNATIEARFSQGLPWQITIVTNAQPVLSAATGTTSSFAVPAQFNGDSLSTMHSVYADGTNAGQAGWTPYQGWGSSFSADYPNKDIVLDPGYLASLTDGKPVTLTFHFWSGATATYTVTKSGSTVTGTLS